MMPPLDADLLRSFVAVVDAGGFTRASERLNLTQSTVSQQIRKLEAAAGRQLLTRDRTGSGAQPTEPGELLLGYARRILALSAEVQEALRAPDAPRTVRLAVPEDFAGRRLIEILSAFAREAPQIRLDTISGWGADMRRRLEAGEVDLALVKREPGEGSSLAVWPERLLWIAGRTARIEAAPVPLAVFPPGCIYRARIIDALERQGRSWRIAYASQGLMGVQAAVASGLGISLLSEDALLPEHRRLTPRDGFDEPRPTELALVAQARRMPPAVRSVADFLTNVVGEVVLRRN
ncbi:LysR family transcriptional regulator [Methylobacterium oryzisoli]|uniref:LysR family transcriptional regulator n=1 Tax=Methylobacterium oryzisoli TaxID=3385502 RepID=UPI0038923DE4